MGTGYVLVRLFHAPQMGSCALMVISNSRQYIFFHIPKCGGTTITHLLSEGLSWNDVVIGGTELGELLQGHFRARYGLGKHSLPSEVREIIGQPLYEGYFKFAFVRDPVHRFISASQFVKRHVDRGTHWMVRALGHGQIREIRRIRTVSQMMRSQLVQGLFERLQANAHSARNDIDLYFAPQSLYLDTIERDAGRFVYLRIDAIDRAWPILQSHGVVAAGTVPDASRRNRSAPVLSVDIDSSALSLLRDWYQSDCLNLGSTISSF